MFLVQFKIDSSETSYILLSMLQSYSHQQTILKTNSTFISMDDIILAPDDGYHRIHQKISRFACFSRIELNFLKFDWLTVLTCLIFKITFFV